MSHNGSDKCLWDCIERNHGHCIYNCANESCDKNDLCISHCTERNHGHCVDFGCSNSKSYSVFSLERRKII